jgi:hypothetical protein
MSVGTIEVKHVTFMSKLKIMGNLLTKLDDALTSDNVVDDDSVSWMTLKKFNDIRTIHSAMNDTYEADVIDILTEYYCGNSLKKKRAIEQYDIRVTTGGYSGKLSQCIKFVEALHAHICDSKSRTDDISMLIQEYKRTAVNCVVHEVDYFECECGSEMTVVSSSSELICPDCGISKKLWGTVFEDVQFFSQEGQKTKTGNYDPVRHCRFHIERIQAVEGVVIPSECLDAVRKCVRRDRLMLKRLLCEQVRNYLKETGFTEFNDHVPKIRKLISHVAPPLLSSTELKQLYAKFNCAVSAFDQVKPAGKSNTIYYPYIIYKILHDMLTRNRRKTLILECIHLQSRDTLISNDVLWESMCELMPSVTYKPTDRSDQIIDF